MDNSILQTSELFKEIETDDMDQLKKYEREFVDDKLSREYIFTLLL